MIYVRDEDSNELWGPTALPIREDGAPYVVRHGQGYSVFEYSSHGVSLELVQYVPLEDSIKISRLKIRNLSARSRHLSVTAYVEWVLGTSRGASAPFVVTEIDPDTRAMLARNFFSADYGSRVAFADLGGRQLSWTGDRTDFLGRNGSLDNPAALASAAPLSERVGAGLDPCVAPIRRSATRCPNRGLARATVSDRLQRRRAGRHAGAFQRRGSMATRERPGSRPLRVGSTGRPPHRHANE